MKFFRRKSLSATRRKALLITAENKIPRTSSRQKKYWQLKFQAIFKGFSNAGSGILIWRYKFWRLILVTLVGIFLLFAWGSPYFKVAQVTTNQLPPWFESDQWQVFLHELKGENLLLLNHAEWERVAQRTFPEMERLSISEQWPNQVILEVTLKPAVLSILNEETASFYRLTADGIILPPWSELDQGVIKVKDYEEPILLGKSFAYLSAEKIERLQKSYQLISQLWDWSVTEQWFYPYARELHLKVNDRLWLWVDIDRSVETQIEKVVIAAESLGLPNRRWEYLDLRIPDQIFYR